MRPAPAPLVGSAPAAADVGVPEGTIARAVALARRGAEAVAVLSGRPAAGIDPDAVAAHVLLPAVLAVRSGSPDWARPPEPRPAPGRGFLAADLGAPGDEETYERMLATLPADADAGTVEAAAQDWHLPVVAYRRRFGRAGPPVGTRHRRPAGRGPVRRPASEGAGPLTGVRVVDLTAMWAGPLATWLLAAAGAEVVKVESQVRPDGMRGQPALFASLDRNKSHVDLDLRHERARAELEDRIAEADVVVHSFSPRVMPNFGLGPERLVALNSRLVSVSLPAFPAGIPQHPWVAYGTGAHAFAGLGDVGGGRFAAPAVTYPDPLAGLAAFAATVEGLVAGGAIIEVSLLEAIAPITAVATAPISAVRGLAVPVDAVVAGLVERLDRREFFDGEGHPATPFWPAAVSDE